MTSSHPSKDESVSSIIGYNIIENMKKSQANISLYELAKLSGQREMIVNTFMPIPSTKKTSTSSKATSSCQSKILVNLESIVNVANANSRSSTPPLLLTF